MIKIIKYTSNNTEKITIRDQLKRWLIPKKWQHFLRVKKNILINNTYQPFNYTLRNNDIITMIFDFPPRSTNQTYLSSKIPLNIIYEDDDILVINKPHGQKSHPNSPTENDTVMNSAETYLNRQQLHPYMIHRLDKETSGLMMIAKNPYVVPIMNRQLTTKIFNRSYYAVVNLLNKIPSKGTINQPITRDTDDKRKWTVSDSGLDSTTVFKVIKKNPNFALLDINLLTGRTHQIRVHLSHTGWPIVGDPLYNNFYTNSKMLLMAYKISYVKPFSSQKNSVEIKIPTEYKFKS